MNSRILTLDERLHWSPGPTVGEDFSQESLADLLEICIFRCDDFAVVLHESGVNHEIYDLLGECVVACGQYMAASCRKSFLESQYALLCAEVCSSTAALCRHLDCEASRACRWACLACAERIRIAFEPITLN